MDEVDAADAVAIGECVLAHASLHACTPALPLPVPAHWLLTMSKTPATTTPHFLPPSACRHDKHATPDNTRLCEQRSHWLQGRRGPDTPDDAAHADAADAGHWGRGAQGEGTGTPESSHAAVLCRTTQRLSSTHAHTTKMCPPRPPRADDWRLADGPEGAQPAQRWPRLG